MRPASGDGPFATLPVARVPPGPCPPSRPSASRPTQRLPYVRAPGGGPDRQRRRSVEGGPPMADPSTVPQQTFDDDAYDLEDSSRALEFLYDGRPLTADEFTAHVQSYNFGAQGLAPPDFVVLHHTASPCTVLTQADARAAGEAWIRNAWVWDADEGGKS